MVSGIVVHGKQARAAKYRALMIRFQSHRQPSLAEIDGPLLTALDDNEPWVRMNPYLARDLLAEGYDQGFSLKQYCPAKDVHLVIGSLILKHRLRLSDRGQAPRYSSNPICNASLDARVNGWTHHLRLHCLSRSASAWVNDIIEALEKAVKKSPMAAC